MPKAPQPESGRLFLREDFRSTMGPGEEHGGPPQDSRGQRGGVLSEIRIQGRASGPGQEPSDPAAYRPSAAEVEALRLRAADGLEKGLAFVAKHGSELGLARAHALLGAVPVEECTALIAGRQLGDGAFDSLGLLAGGARGLANAGLEDRQLATLEALIALSDLSALQHPCLESAASFLQAVQLEDGSWGDAGLPGEERIFASGLLAGLLGRTRVVRPEVLDAAGEFLAEQFSPDRISDRNWPALTGFGVFFANVGHEMADSALQWVGRELERSFKTRAHDAASILRTLMHCNAIAVPGATLDPFLLLTSLLGEQSSDGGFEELAPGVDRTRVEPTLDALLGIVRLCAVL